MRALLLFLERSGYPEETYHTFSYSPLRDDDGRVVGMLCVVSEDTAAGDRRAADGDAAGPGVRPQRGAHRGARVLAFAHRQLSQNLRDLPVHADLPLRRRR